MRGVCRAAVVSGLIALGGCVLNDDVVHVPYAPHGGPSVTGQPPVAVTVTDARTTNRGRIGTKKTGLGGYAGAVRADEEVTAVVRRATVSELVARKYREATGGATVSLAVIRLFADFDANPFSVRSFGTSDLDVVVRRGDAIVYTRSIHGTDEHFVFAEVGSSAADSVSRALGAALDKLFADPAFQQALSP